MKSSLRMMKRTPRVDLLGFLLVLGSAFVSTGCGEKRHVAFVNSRPTASTTSSTLGSTIESTISPAPQLGDRRSDEDPTYPALPPPAIPPGARRKAPRATDLPAEREMVSRTVPTANTTHGESRREDALALGPPPTSRDTETLRPSGRDEQTLENTRAESIPDTERDEQDRTRFDGKRSPADESTKNPAKVDERNRRSPERRTDGSFRLQAGDDLDLVFIESWSKGTEYRLLPGDEIRVEYVVGSDGGLRDQSPLDRTVRLQPDGMISLPYVGVVTASGLTVRELAQQLTGLYQDLYVNPNILVSLVSTGGGLAELQKALQAAGGRTTRVAPDGTIMVPFLGAVPAENLQLTELEEEINERFRRAAPGFGVMIRWAGRQ